MPSPILERLRPRAADITGLVLAGGRGQRWGGRDKGLVEHAGRPLVEWVLDALMPQVGAILISANRNLARYGTYGYPVVQDRSNDFQGPLAGISAGLGQAASLWMVTAPCDGPALPPDLVDRLTLALAEQGGEVAAAAVDGHIQPVYALIPIALTQDLAGYLTNGGRSVVGWLHEHPLALADFSDRPGAFVNLNEPG
jgi:molybdenum cofactor guanylyltransferase